MNTEGGRSGGRDGKFAQPACLSVSVYLAQSDDEEVGDDGDDCAGHDHVGEHLVDARPGDQTKHRQLRARQGKAGGQVGRQAGRAHTHTEQQPPSRGSERGKAG